MHLLNKLTGAAAVALCLLFAASAAQATGISGSWTSHDYSYGLNFNDIIWVDCNKLDYNRDWSWDWKSDGHNVVGYFGYDYGHHLSYLWKWKLWHLKKWKCEVPIPEPSSALVFGAGLLIVRGATRRRRR